MSPEIIKIKNTAVKGRFYYFICQLYQRNPDDILSPIISLYNNTFNVNGSYNKNISSLFYILNSQYIYKLNEGKTYYQIKVEHYNNNSPFFLFPQILMLPDEYQMSLYDVSYYSISRPSFINQDSKAFQLIVKQYQFKRLVLNPQQAESIQIAAFSTHRLQFQTEDDFFLDPNRLDLTISNYKSIENIEKQRYNLILQFSTRQIRQVSICYQMMDLNECMVLNDSYQELNNTKLQGKKNSAFNQIDIKWAKLTQNTLIITIDILFCEPNYFFYQENCLQYCDRQVSGSYCDNKCQEGFFQMNNKCYQCSFGCQNCINQNECTKCYSQFMIDDGFCIDYCLKNQYYQNQKCSDCIEDCNNCAIKKQTLLDFEKCSQCEYVATCNLQQICHNSCLECEGQLKYDCTKCSPLYSNKYGLCLIQLN